MVRGRTIIITGIFRTLPPTHGKIKNSKNVQLYLFEKFVGGIYKAEFVVSSLQLEQRTQSTGILWLEQKD